LPAELGEDGGKQQRERRPRVDTDRHRDERRGDEDPTVEERQRSARDRALDQRIRFSGGSPRAGGSVFSALGVAGASSMPAVQPETCGVINTLESSWKGRRAGKVGPGSFG